MTCGIASRVNLLSASPPVDFKRVSKWLGHSAFTLTLDVYGDYINDDVFPTCRIGAACRGAIERGATRAPERLACSVVGFDRQMGGSRTSHSTVPASSLKKSVSNR